MNFAWSYFCFISLLFLSSAIWGSSGDNLEDFLQCVSLHSSNSTVVITPSFSSYSSVLNFTIRNLRFSGADIPKPVAIVTPSQASHVQASIICSKKHGFQIRTRSGGHDFEGLSYVSDVPYVLIDLINLRSVTVDTKHNTAWVQSGAILGELYYEIGKKTRTLGFPAGIAPTVGVGGYLSGGGYGMMVRKYGLAVDNVVDAYLVDANGKLLDRKSMGEDLFWAIRGGGGGSFGIVLAWKIKLVRVPRTVTSFAVTKTWDQNAAKLVHRWQYVAPEIDENLFIFVMVTASNSSGGGGRTMGVSFYSLFLGKANKLLSIMEKSFPELGLTKEDCLETSWVESTTLPLSWFITGEPLEDLRLEDLLDRTPLTSGRFKIKSDFATKPMSETAMKDRTPLTSDRFKIKSDFATKPMSETAMEGMWKRFRSGETETVQLILIPYGGKMNKISETKTPSPHRAGYHFKIAYYVTWKQRDADSRHLKWSRELYKYMTPFVSKSPRAAYINYRDLDIGRNNKEGTPTSYEEASVWGLKYFGNNFERLVEVKRKVDPFNLFQHEQSIPPAAKICLSPKLFLILQNY